MNVIRRLLLVGAVTAPLLGHANGGISHEVEVKTSGALIPGDGGPLAAIRLVKDEAVECVSELLTITLRKADVGVRVEYVLRNHGDTKQIPYAFPFAVGEYVVHANGQQPARRVLGAPVGYQLLVDGKKAATEEREGVEVPPEIPAPVIDHQDRDLLKLYWPRGEEPKDAAKSRYRWFYQVSPVELPGGKDVRLEVSYSAPYLVHRYTDTSSESGAASQTTPPSFSYLLSTGDGWRGGKIGRLEVRIVGKGDMLPRHGIQGLPFVRKGDVATWVGADVTPTLDMNLFIQRSEFRRATLTADRDVPSPILNGVSTDAAWVSPPIGPSSPATLALRASGDWGFNLRLPSPTTRYRLGLAFKAGSPQPARARVELVSAGGEREAFHASFGEVSAEQLKASGGYRYVYFDMADPPAQLRLTFLEARPGKSGDRRLQVTGVVLDEDTADYYDKIPQGR